MTSHDRNAIDELRFILDRAKLQGTRDVLVPLDQFEELVEGALELHDLVTDLDGSDAIEVRTARDEALAENEELSTALEKTKDALKDAQEELAELRSRLGNMPEPALC